MKLYTFIIKLNKLYKNIFFIYKKLIISTLKDTLKEKKYEDGADGNELTEL